MSYVHGLSYGGDSLHDKFNGTGNYTPASVLFAREQKRKEDAQKARSDFIANLLSSKLNGSDVRIKLSSLDRTARVVKAKAGAIAVFYDGCTITVSPFSLYPIAT